MRISTLTTAIVTALVAAAVAAPVAGNLRESERNEVEEAAQSLESTVDESLSEIGEGQSLEDPATEVFGAIDRPEQLESALGPLRSSIQALLTPIDCMA